MKKSFTHLHLHTQYSILDGVVRIPDLVEKLKEFNMNACAITDHGNMHAANKFHGALSAEGIKPILGCEIYVAPRSRLKKEFGIDNKYYHMVLLAKDLEGYKNLVKIVSDANIEGYYFKPRTDFETLKKYNKGLFALSACLTGVLSKPIKEKNIKKAKENLEKLLDIYKDNFFIEIQHNGIDLQEKVNTTLLELAKEYDVPIVATNDVHYLEKDDSQVQEILWAIRDGKTLDDPTHLKPETHELYLKNQDEMLTLFKETPEAIENTQKITNAIEEYSIAFERIEPKYLSLPSNFKDTNEYLRHLTFEGAKEKYGEITKDLEDRLNMELEVIHDKGYDDYFLITRDFIKYAKEKGIVVGIRGSACGSAVAYCIGITHIEPISWELYFERFLNPERPSPPDIDIDVADNRRDEIIQYAIDTFGAQNVKQIGTFSKLQTRQAIRDVSRVLGIDLEIANKLSKMVQVQFGKAFSIDKMMEVDPEFKEIINSSPQLKKMASIVKKLAGMPRGISTHACGLVITPKPVDSFAPLQRDSKGEGIGMTQYEMSDVEGVGLMKFDFLGLRNLSVIGETLKKIKTHLGIDLDLEKIDPNDQPTFQTINAGKTVGVFQLESEGMKKAIRTIKPENLEEICYLLAAYRPGPMEYIPEYAAVKFGKKEAEYAIPELEPILSITNGVITYQEQVIRIAVDIAGYTMGHADKLRKAMGKKKWDIMEKEKPIFIEGAVKRGFDRKKIEEIWDKLVKFANYGFNKAHAASYSMVSYWTAYLKTHYPLHYMASLLESDLDNFDRVSIDLAECNNLNIDVLPPDINKSDVKFTIEGEKGIRFGLAAIKNVGENIVTDIVKEREENGEYKNLDDFVYRNIKGKLQQRSIEYLIMAGAFDSFGKRSALLKILPDLVEKYKKHAKAQIEGQIGLFAISGTENDIEPTPLPEIPEASLSQRLEWEKELLGLYISSHPLDPLEDFFVEKNVTTIAKAKQLKQNKVVILGCLISEVKRITTKKGDNMAVLKLEDKTGSISAVLFPSTYQELKPYIIPNTPILVGGKINIRRRQTNEDKEEETEERSVIIQKMKNIDPAQYASEFDGIVFKITDDHSDKQVQELKDAIRQNPGKTKVKVIINRNNERNTIILKHKVQVNATIKKLQKIFS